MFRIDACFRAIPEEFLKSCVLERLDHFNTVSLLDTRVNGDDSLIHRFLSWNMEFMPKN
jgi:hypothetical protein